jgi:hypothetical protein
MQHAAPSDRPGRRPPRGELGDRDREILDFERDWPSHQGGKAVAIRERFAISSARYYQLLARLVDDPAAAAHDPLVVARLRRRRAARDRRRTSGALGRRGG